MPGGTSSGHTCAPGRASSGHICASGCALLLSELRQERWNRPTSLQSMGAPGSFRFLFILAVLMFIRADAAFAIAADEFLAGVVDRNHPRMRNALRRILFILGEALLFDLAICLLERAVSLFLFLFSA